MSEIKPIQYWFISTKSQFADMALANIDVWEKPIPATQQNPNDTVMHVLEAAPVLKMMNEMAEVIKQSQFHCVRVHEYGDETQTQKTMTSNIKALESYKSFLAQIEKEK